MTKEDYMKLSKERLAELLVERDSNIRIVPMNIPSWHPTCYEGGPCTNPFHDCINCPRQFSSDGTYTTSTTASISIQNIKSPLWKKVDQPIYINTKDIALVQKKDQSDLFKGCLLYLDHTLDPKVDERYILLNDLL